MNIELKNKILKGEININDQSLYFKYLIRALLYKLNTLVTLRDKHIPHYIINTGDDILYLEEKGYDFSIEPYEQSNENNITSQCPRAIVNIGGISIDKDQLTNPYARGSFDIEYNGRLVGFNAEFRRLPLRLSVTIKYWCDNFTDMMSISQSIVSNMMFVIPFKFDYMGQTIYANISTPENLQHNTNIEIDGYTTETKLRSMEIELEILSNIPVFRPSTVMENDCMISNTGLRVHLKPNDTEEVRVPEDIQACIDIFRAGEYLMIEGLDISKNDEIIIRAV